MIGVEVKWIITSLSKNLKRGSLILSAVLLRTSTLCDRESHCYHNILYPLVFFHIDQF